MKLKIDVEALDKIILAGLKRQLKYIKHPKHPSTHPNDIIMEKKLKAAMKTLIKYYGGE